MQALLSKTVNLSQMMLLANINRASVNRKPLSRDKKKSFYTTLHEQQQQQQKKSFIRKLNIAFLKKKKKTTQDSFPFVSITSEGIKTAKL